MAARVSRSMVHVQIADLRMADVLVWSDRTLERTAPGEPRPRVRARHAVRWRSAIAATPRRPAELDEWMTGLPAEEAVPLRMVHGWLALATDDLPAARHELHEAARAAAHAGSFNFACLAFAHLARAEYMAGAWDEALVHVERAAAIAADFKGLAARSYVPWSAAMMAAARRDAPMLAALEASSTPRPRCSPATARPRRSRAPSSPRPGGPRRGAAGVEPVAGPGAPEALSEPGFWPWQSIQAASLLALQRLDELEAFAAAHAAIADRRGLRSAQGRMARVRGQLAMARGEPDAAIAAARGRGRPPRGGRDAARAVDGPARARRGVAPAGPTARRGGRPWPRPRRAHTARAAARGAGGARARRLRAHAGAARRRRPRPPDPRRSARSGGVATGCRTARSRQSCS